MLINQPLVAAERVDQFDVTCSVTGGGLSGQAGAIRHGISKCLVDKNGESRPFSFIALGGSSNGSLLEGHNYTYVGSNYGKSQMK